MEFRQSKEDQPLEYYLECVRRLPKIALDDPRVLGAQAADQIRPYGTGYQHIQFGNNFYLLWSSVAPDCDTDLIIRRVYAKRVEGTEQWDAFITSNAELVERVFTTLKEVYEPYQEVFHAFLDYLNAGDWDSVNAMHEAADHPFRLDATCAYVWDQLNPLLEEAAEAMRVSGIEPEQFYG